MPQAPSAVPGRQLLPEQQPRGQVVASQPLQAPSLQVWPDGQAWHALPTVPQASSALPGMQTSPAQQPDGQLATSQAAATHAPP